MIVQVRPKNQNFVGKILDRVCIMGYIIVAMYVKSHILKYNALHLYTLRTFLRQRTWQSAGRSILGCYQ